MAGQTRLPTFSMKKTSVSRQGDVVERAVDQVGVEVAGLAGGDGARGDAGLLAGARASLSVARSAETAPSRQPFAGGGAGGGLEHGGLAGARASPSG